MSQHESHGDLLDNIYKWTRHVYDASRKYFLFGRDTLLRKMEVPENGRVLEVGCGTARNLVLLARKAPTARLYGLDASQEMLKTAQRNVEKAGLSNRIQLGFGYAEQFHPAEVWADIDRDEAFDVIFFSYSLTMIPGWREALHHCMTLLTPGGKIEIVDFWDQAGYPRWFQSFLQWWLRQFHVAFQPELHDELRQLEADNRVELELYPVGKRYAYIAHISPRPDESTLRQQISVRDLHTASA